MPKHKIKTDGSQSPVSMSPRQTPCHPVRILALDPGTRLTGMAVFDSGELLDVKVKDFGYKKSTRELLEAATQFLDKQIEIYRPQFIIIEKTFIYQNKNSSKLVVLAGEFRTIGKAHRLSVIEYAPRTARKIVLGNGNATKEMVAEALCRRFSHLWIYREQTHLWKKSYWLNAFDAACVGMAFLIDLELVAPLDLSA